MTELASSVFILLCLLKSVLMYENQFMGDNHEYNHEFVQDTTASSISINLKDGDNEKNSLSASMPLEISFTIKTDEYAAPEVKSDPNIIENHSVISHFSTYNSNDNLNPRLHFDINSEPPYNPGPDYNGLHRPLGPGFHNWPEYGRYDNDAEYNFIGEQKSVNSHMYNKTLSDSTAAKDIKNTSNTPTANSTLHKHSSHKADFDVRSVVDSIFKPNSTSSPGSSSPPHVSRNILNADEPQSAINSPNCNRCYDLHRSERSINSHVSEPILDIPNHSNGNKPESSFYSSVPFPPFYLPGLSNYPPTPINIFDLFRSVTPVTSPLIKTNTVMSPVDIMRLQSLFSSGQYGIPNLNRIDSPLYSLATNSPLNVSPFNSVTPIGLHKINNSGPQDMSSSLAHLHAPFPHHKLNDSKPDSPFYDPGSPFGVHILKNLIDSKLPDPEILKLLNHLQKPGNSNNHQGLQNLPSGVQYPISSQVKSNAIPPSVNSPTDILTYIYPKLYGIDPQTLIASKSEAPVSEDESTNRQDKNKCNNLDAMKLREIVKEELHKEIKEFRNSINDCSRYIDDNISIVERIQKKILKKISNVEKMMKTSKQEIIITSTADSDVEYVPKKNYDIEQNEPKVNATDYIIDERPRDTVHQPLSHSSDHDSPSKSVTESDVTGHKADAAQYNNPVLKTSNIKLPLYKTTDIVLNKRLISNNKPISRLKSTPYPISGTRLNVVVLVNTDPQHDKTLPPGVKDEKPAYHPGYASSGDEIKERKSGLRQIKTRSNDFNTINHQVGNLLQNTFHEIGGYPLQKRRRI